jgi:hypothetical protein
MFLLISLLLIAIAYEACQALSRFGGPTAADVNAAAKPSHQSPSHLTSPLLL